MRREGYPPKAVLSALVSHWRESWPEADLSLAAVQRLYPWIVQKWQEGWTLDKLAGSACKCVDNKVFPSEAARRPLLRRPLAVPPDVEPGIPFGTEDMRDAPTVARLKNQAEVAELRLRQLEMELEIQYKRKAIAGPRSVPKIEAQIERLVARKREEQTRKTEAEQKLSSLKSGSPVSRKPKAAPEPREAKPQTTEKAAPKPKAKKPRAEKPATKQPSAAATAESSKKAAPDAAQDFDLAAIEDVVVGLFDDDDKKGKK